MLKLTLGTTERTMATLGRDDWRYGFTTNRAELDAISRYWVEQHLAKTHAPPRRCFPPLC